MNENMAGLRVCSTVCVGEKSRTGLSHFCSEVLNQRVPDCIFIGGCDWTERRFQSLSLSASLISRIWFSVSLIFFFKSASSYSYFLTWDWSS